MFGLVNLTRTQRLVLGIFVLLVVDLIWVASSELTEYIFKDEHYDKPYFSTFLKTSMFVVFLLGFLFWRPWIQQCRKAHLNGSDSDDKIETEKLLSDPMYVPTAFDDKSSGNESDDITNNLGKTRSVRFSQLSEVRQLSDVQADAMIQARLSYSATMRSEELKQRMASRLTIKQVAKLSAIFCFIWYGANLAYQEALKDTEAGIVNVLSSTSGLFTLVLAALFPSAASDKVTLSKFVAVLLSIGGVVLVSISDLNLEKDVEIPIGALWALCGAFLYAVYLVLIKRKVDNEDKLDIPMFFGFVGFFNILLLWPGFFILHYSGAEEFQLPNKEQWMYMALNGIIGTTLSELLWLWGCFLTSSLLATMSLSLTIPLTMLADVVFKGVTYSWMFYVGSVPIFIAFFAVSLMSHYESWDPVLVLIKKIVHGVCRLVMIPTRFRERTDIDREQSESLIGINTDS
ncbi:unnamed protein product [Owenia fusiformis]|uniref:Solute carrier family 35 member F5 n=1 Tax=Owenia fusiformis TaxID=6347 RepID=A0A8J1UKQ6_OWEFU|nr:unnamed protein product [Owenia fusiformis]